MKLPAIVRKTAALCLFLAGHAAHATVLTFTMPDGQTLDAPPACASDPGCQLQAGLPAALSPGLLADQALMPAPANDIRHFTSPLAAAGAEDDVFLSLIGNQAKATPSVAAERQDAAGEESDELALMRKLSQGLRQTYTNIHALVALPDHYRGNARDAGNAPSVQCHEGINIGCDAGGFAPVMGSLCVGSDGSYNSIGAANQAACPAGSVYVGNKRGAGMVEYAAYAQSLRSFAKDASSRYSLQSFDERYSRNDAGARQYRRCSDCDPDTGLAAEPGLLLRAMRWLREPSSMLVLVLGAIAVLGADAVIRRRRR
jgi:hypothetical protein